MSELSEWAAPQLAALEVRFAALFSSAWPPELVTACRYPLQTGGKRVRPLLTLASARAVGASEQVALSAAVAVELVHTYSLVHDDLPAMDDDQERRGRPTVHVAFGEAAAILVGDALLTEAFAVLAETGPLAAPLIRELAGAAGAAGMIAGQAADIGMGGPVETLDALHRLHQGKTGALLRAAARMGGIAGEATPAELTALSEFGEAIGLAFQIHDDLLDADQDAHPDGPPSFVRLLGAAGTAAAARHHADRAVAAAGRLAVPDMLAALARFSVERSH